MSSFFLLSFILSPIIVGVNRFAQGVKQTFNKAEAPNKASADYCYLLDAEPPVTDSS